MQYSIHNTEVVPYLIAEQVAGANNTDAVTYLVERSERHYENNQHFRKLINNKRKDSRVTLSNFMAHWLQAFNKFNQLKNN